jgi:cell division protein FtsL
MANGSPKLISAGQFWLGVIAIVVTLIGGSISVTLHISNIATEVKLNRNEINHNADQILENKLDIKKLNRYLPVEPISQNE